MKAGITTTTTKTEDGRENPLLLPTTILRLDQETAESILVVVRESLIFMGGGTAASVFWHVAKRSNLNGVDVVLKPEKFIEALRRIFGDGGALFIERKMVRDIVSKLNVGDGVGYESYVEILRIIAERKKTN